MKALRRHKNKITTDLDLKRDEDEVEQGRDFRAAVRTVCTTLVPQAQKISDLTGKSVYACTMGLLRPHIKREINNRHYPDFVDGREKVWNVRAIFYHSAYSGQLEELAVCDVEQCRGFDEIIQLIRDYVDQAHEEQGVKPSNAMPFDYTTLSKRIGGMRSAISKNGGLASTHIPYVVNDVHFSCSVTIAREEIDLTTDG